MATHHNERIRLSYPLSLDSSGSCRCRSILDSSCPMQRQRRRCDCRRREKSREHETMKRIERVRFSTKEIVSMGCYHCQNSGQTRLKSGFSFHNQVWRSGSFTFAWSTKRVSVTLWRNESKKVKIQRKNSPWIECTSRSKVSRILISSIWLSDCVRRKTRASRGRKQKAKSDWRKVRTKFFASSLWEPSLSLITGMINYDPCPTASSVSGEAELEGESFELFEAICIFGWWSLRKGRSPLLLIWRCLFHTIETSRLNRIKTSSQNQQFATSNPISTLS